MEVSVTPPVDDATELVLRSALRAAGVEEPRAHDDEGAWRRAGLEEGVELNDPEAGYTPSPRSTRGATRA